MVVNFEPDGPDHDAFVLGGIADIAQQIVARAGGIIVGFIVVFAVTAVDVAAEVPVEVVVAPVDIVAG